MTMLRHRILQARANDEGSLMLAMFAILVISSLTVVIAATVVTGAKQSLQDQRFEQALEVAEVGLSQMNSLIQSNPKAVSMAPLTGTTTDGGSYSVSATKCSSNRVPVGRASVESNRSTRSWTPRFPARESR